MARLLAVAAKLRVSDRNKVVNEINGTQITPAAPILKPR
jgi:hypothetical protein